MIKYFLLIIFFVGSESLFAHQEDTLFLKRVLKDTPYVIYHAIFIDTTADLKNALINFNFSKFDSGTYYRGLKSIPRPKRNIIQDRGLPKKWIALHQFKGKQYLYYPSDFGYHYRFELTDSTTIDFAMEGAEPSRLIKITQPSPDQFNIIRKNRWEGTLIEIKIIDSAKGIAVFTFGKTKFNNELRRVLMVDASKTHFFPTIVNYCPTDKQVEFEFEIVDFKSLLK